MTFLRRLAGAFLLLAAPAVGLAAALAVVAGAARLTADIPALGTVGLIAFTAASAPVVLAGLRAVRSPNRRRRAAVVCLALVVAVAAAGVVVVRPPASAHASRPARLEPGFHAWTLSTGSRITYLHAAAGTPAPANPPVIFLHGGPGTPGAALPVVAPDLVAAGFSVYAYDQLGSGTSTRLQDPAGYTVARHVADLEAIRATIGASQVILVGQSWGAQLAAAYLRAHPDRVAGAVFVSPGPLWAGAFHGHPVGEPWDRLTSAQRRQVTEAVSTPRMLAASLLLPRAPRAAHALVGDDEADAAMRAAALPGKDTTMCPGESGGVPHHRPLGFYVNQVTAADAAAEPDPRPALRRLDVPTLVLRGTCDFLRPAVAADYVKTFRGSVFVAVPGAGHAIARGRPGVYREEILAFAQTVVRS